MESRADKPDDPTPTRARLRPERRWWYVLLLVPFVALLVPPFYTRLTPRLAAWPFFYWWQFAWVLVTAFILAVVYRLTTRHVPVDPARDGARGDHDGPDAGEDR